MQKINRAGHSLPVLPAVFPGISKLMSISGQNDKWQTLGLASHYGVSICIAQMQEKFPLMQPLLQFLSQGTPADVDAAVMKTKVGALLSDSAAPAQVH